MNALNAFTAARIAETLARSKVGVLKALAQITPADQVVRRGGKTSLWRIEQLPEAWREKLAALAETSGCRDGAHLLSTSTAPWQPEISGQPVTLGELAPPCIAYAQRLQKALLPTLARLTSDDYTPDARAEKIGLDAYRRIFGKSSVEHYRRLIRRTVDRAGVRRDFSRPELFLPENRQLRRAMRVAPALSGVGVLSAAIALVGNVARYTVADRAHLWDSALKEIQRQIDTGTDERSARFQVLTTLHDSLSLPLAASREALQKALQRKWERWVVCGRRPGANVDCRKGRSGKCHGSPFTEADYDLTGARIQKSGTLAQAYRTLYRTGRYSAGVYATYAANVLDKSRVPKPLRLRYNAAVIEGLLMQRQGGRGAATYGATSRKDWSAVPTGSEAQSDDCTLPVLFWVPSEDGGFRLIQGQFLPWIDTRSTYIHCFQLLPKESYGSVDIVRGLAQLNDVFGLPDALALEMGVWKESLLIKGRGDEVPTKDRVYGLRDLGIEIRHSTGPEDKPIEYVFRILQDHMEGERGYCGRDQRKDCPEAVKRARAEVEAGKCHPSKYFYSYAEWTARLNEICDAYNDEVQCGEKLRGLSPRQTFVKYLGAPPMRLDDSTRYLIASHRRIVPIKAKGLTIDIGKTAYTYKNVETGRRIGQRVLAWFDLEDPSLISVTTLDGKDPFTVERETLVPGFRAPRATVLQSKRENAPHMAPLKQLYSRLRKEYREECGGTYARKVVTDAATRELGATIGKQKADIKATQERTQRTRRTVADKSARAGLRLPSTNNLQRLEAQQRLAELMSHDADEQSGDE